MTVIVNWFWAGRACQIVDRQITSRGAQGITVNDSLSVKACVFLCRDALVSIAYTGVAAAGAKWMDLQIASALAGQTLEPAMMQPGSRALALPLVKVIENLRRGLRARLATVSIQHRERLTLSMVGWHLPYPYRPLYFVLAEGPGGEFEVRHRQVGKFLRTCPTGLFLESLGDVGETVDTKLRELEYNAELDHDGLERFIRSSILARSAETSTVGRAALAVRLCPRGIDAHVQFTSYPDPNRDPQRQSLLESAWTLSPAMTCSPSTSSLFGEYSACGHYVVGGYEDAQCNLRVATRLPVADATFGGPMVFSVGVSPRPPVPSG